MRRCGQAESETSLESRKGRIEPRIRLCRGYSESIRERAARHGLPSSVAAATYDVTSRRDRGNEEFRKPAYGPPWRKAERRIEPRITRITRIMGRRGGTKNFGNRKPETGERKAESGKEN